MKKTPVVLLTGFLGSGKTTLLSALLESPAFVRTAVIINEFGAIGLDGDLVLHQEEQIIEMSTGCLCCTIRGDVQETLMALHDRCLAEGALLEQVIIETTGLADPAPVVHTLTADWRLEQHYQFAGIVTAVDVLHVEGTIETHDECMKQIAMADALVFTKADLLGASIREAALARLHEQGMRINPGVATFGKDEVCGAFAHVLAQGRYDLQARPESVRDWMNTEAFEHAHLHHHDHHHDVNRHGTDIHAFCLTLDEPMEGFALMLAIDLLRASLGANLLRLKAILQTRDAPLQPVVMHAVQHTLHSLERLPYWPDEDRRSRLVFITRGLPKAEMEKYFARFTEAAQAASQR